MQTLKANSPLPREALNYIKDKKLKPSYDYRDVWREEHAHAFAVAKALQLDVLQDLKDAVEGALAEGITLREFQKGLAPHLIKKGWWGKKTMRDPQTGKEVPVQLGSGRRLKTIYDTNTKQAYHAGQWQRGQRSAAHTHILYQVGPSRNHREQHLAWNGLVLPKEHEFWQTNTPLNGWGCKCSIRFITRQKLERLRKEGIPNNTNIYDGRPRGTVNIKESVTLKKRAYLNKRTGQTHIGIKGVTPGFEFNPAFGRGESLSRTFTGKLKEFKETFPSPVPQGAPVSRALQIRTIRHRETVERALTGIDQVHGDGALPEIPIFYRRSDNYLGAYSFSPQAHTAGPIYLADNINELTVIHEIGHFLDHQGLPGKGFASEGSRLTKGLMNAIRNSEEIQYILAAPPSGLKDYFLDPSEQFARGYTQYIAGKSGNETLQRQIEEIVSKRGQGDGGSYTQWAEESFLPILVEFDRLFKELKWLK